jgi:hypothetical protein
MINSIQTLAISERKITPIVAADRAAMRVVQGPCDVFCKRRPFGTIRRDMGRRLSKPIWVVDFDGVLYRDFSRHGHVDVRQSS